MKVPRRQFLYLAAVATTLPTLSRFASAQSYPTRQVHLLEGFGAGGAPDIVARLIGENAVYIPCGEPRDCDEVRSIGNKATAIYVRPVRVNGR